MAQLSYISGLLLILLLAWAVSKLLRNQRLDGIADIIRSSVIFLLILESGLSILYRIENKSWIFSRTVHPNRELFRKQPYLGVGSRPDLDLTFDGRQITTDEEGHRKTFPGDGGNGSNFRIAAIGGSTTFGVAVSDAESWPGRLQDKTGGDTLVYNLGVPGHTTVEHLVTASLYLEKIRPDLIIIQCGMNDMRMSHVNGLGVDYSNFHYPGLVGTMGLCYLEAIPSVASLYYLVRLMQECRLYPVCEFHSTIVSGKEGSGADAAALGIYEGNLRRLIHACRYYTNEILLLPQAIRKDVSGKDKMRWWFPYLRGDDLNAVMEVYNRKTMEIAGETGVGFAGGIFSDLVENSDFSDDCHLNAAGNEKLARKLYEIIKKTPEDPAVVPE